MDRCRTLFVGICLGAASAFAQAPGVDPAELGLGRMWTFEDPPLAWLQQEYGFRPDARWLDAVRLASLRFGRGCSASFVSPQGLIMTNHHCARDAVAQVEGERDLLRDGFVAATFADEIRLPGLTVQQLVATTDVTARMQQGVADTDSPKAAEGKRQQNGDRILEEARRQRPELQPQLVKLFQGAVWQLYQYRVFDDIRLVMAPHLQSAHFGGDPDNFVYPRYATDFSFCRAYVDGKPADTTDCSFGWSDGPAEGQLVILTGNPGSTQRLLTQAQLEYLRDARYPRVRELIDNRIAIMRELAAKDPQHEKELRTRILAFENGQKLYRGEHGALLDASFMARKARAEASFRQRIAAVPELASRYGTSWDELAAVAAERTRAEPAANFHGAGGSPLLLRALALVEFASTGAEDAANRARDTRVTDDPLQQAFFVDHLVRARRWLGPDDPFLRAVLGGREPAAAATALREGSRLGDDAHVKELLAGGRTAIDGDEDPALAVARVLWPLAEEARLRSKALDDRESALGAKLGRALFAVYGNAVTPDATFTLRFSDGRVRGYAYNGTLAPWRTVFHGLFARNAEFDGVHPFDLPQPWLLAKDRIDMRAAVDFVCTVDSTGGNSGSPLIDVDRRIVGLLFDGNIESLGNEFFYAEDEGQRSVCVHPQAIVEALTKVYDGAHIVRELRRQQELR